MTYHVTVTAEHIARGSQCASRDCPIFHAFSDVVPGLNLVGSVRAVFDGGERVYLPPSVQLFIEAFDAGREVQPFAFEIEI